MPYALQDREYIEQEALRLHRVSRSQGDRSFGYPDLRSWRPERAAIDAIIRTDEGLILNGIARATLCSDPLLESDGTSLQWLRLNFGQTILAKMREAPRSVADVSAHVIRERVPNASDRAVNRPTKRLPDLFSSPGNQVDRLPSPSSRSAASDDNLNTLLERVIASGFDPLIVGKAILQQAIDERNDFVERGIALTSTILTAYKARTRRR
jgi:hypothetical protein